MNEVLRQLRRNTEDFWEDLRRPEANTTDLYFRRYIGDLLPREKEMWDLPPPPFECDILVLLVGFSYEPLLQSICYYNPKSVLLVLNERYGEDKNHTKMRAILEKLIKELSEKRLINHEPTVIKNQPAFVVDQPEQVFRFLREHLIKELQDGKKVIIDVTGGKKSMGNGASLFGAYTNTPISYVDFDDYNPRSGRPYGDSPRIGLFENPYEAFQLRNWEQVRFYYNRYAFRTAYEVLDKIKAAMASSLEGGDEAESRIPLFETRYIEAVNRLIDVLKFYELWDNGNYHDAREKYKGIHAVLPGFSPPYAVDVLGSYWPHGDNLLKGLETLELGDTQAQIPSFYVRNPDLLIYAQDELGKIERLIEFNQDYRSALIRSVGLGEVLLKARITCLWEEELLEIAECDEETQEPKDFHPMKKLPPEIMDWFDEIRKGVVLSTNLPPVILALRARPGKKELKPFYCKSIKSFFFVRRCHPEAPLVDKKIFFKDEQTQLRHKAAHTYLSVPQEYAEDVYLKVLENFDDFVKNWADFMKSPTKNVNLDDAGRFEIVDWELLCKWCKIDEFLPPISEGKENN